jgi:hypothetical protein
MACIDEAKTLLLQQQVVIHTHISHKHANNGAAGAAMCQVQPAGGRGKPPSQVENNAGSPYQIK